MTKSDPLLWLVQIWTQTNVDTFISDKYMLSSLSFKVQILNVFAYTQLVPHLTRCAKADRNQYQRIGREVHLKIR